MVLDLRVLTMGTPRKGGWCPKCLLPSAYTVDVYAMDEDGVHKVYTARGCSESDDPGHFRSPTKP